MGLGPRQNQVQIPAVLPGLVTGKILFINTVIFRCLTDGSPRLRAVCSAKWGECHRRHRHFSSPVNGCAASLPLLWPSYSLGLCLCCVFLSCRVGFYWSNCLCCGLMSKQAPCTSDGKRALRGGNRLSSKTRVGTWARTRTGQGCCSDLQEMCLVLLPPP